jgi:hypothetical protein
MKLLPSLLGFLLVLAGLSRAGVAHATTTAVYDPSTGLVTVKGIAQTQTLTVPNAISGNFSFPISSIASANANIVALGTVTLDLQCAATLSVKLGDAIVGELPSTWSFVSGSYFAETAQTTGSVTESRITGYSTDTGFMTLLGEATQDFPTFDDLETTVQYSAPADSNPVGVVLKGVLVARASYSCGGVPVVTVGTVSNQPPVDFPLVTSADPQNVTTVTLVPSVPVLPPWGAGLLAMLLGGIALGGAQQTNEKRKYNVPLQQRVHAKVGTSPRACAPAPQRGLWPLRRCGDKGSCTLDTPNTPE